MITTVFVLFTIVLFGTVSSTDIANIISPAERERCSVLPNGVSILRQYACHKWLQCPSNHNLTDYREGECVDGLYYNKDHQKCEPENEVKCPYIHNPYNRCETKVNGTFLVNENDCEAYIYCFNNIEWHAICPIGLVFDPKKNYFVTESEYKCPDEICRYIPQNKFFANKDDCSHYNVCVDGIINIKTCDAGNAFDYNLGRCVPTTEAICYPDAKPVDPATLICQISGTARIGYFPDDKSCTHYYICSKQETGYDRHPKHVKCSFGYFFNSAKLSCEERVHVKCIANRCEDMGNGYVNIAGDCTKYGRCTSDKLTAVSTCGENSYFNEKIQICTPIKVDHAACAA